MKAFPKCLKTAFLVLAFLGWAAGSLLSTRYSKSPFNPNGFPKPVSEAVFSIPFDEAGLMVVYPAALEPDVARLKSLLAGKCGREIPFRRADGLKKEDLISKHLVMIGNIANNPWALELYKKRYAFADAMFPGKGGHIVHPATSIWNRGRNIVVIGASSDRELVRGFESFVALLPQGASRIETLHQLKTNIKMPAPPESIAAIIDNVRNNLKTAKAPYAQLGEWGLNYFLTGDKRWAAHFRDGFAIAYEQAEKTGDWVPEPWTSVYFSLKNLFQAWDLVDDDPFFSSRDRKMIEEVLWGYTTFVRNMILLDKNIAPAGEPRQNHTAHMGLGLYFAHRYYTQKYGLAGLDSLVDQYRLAFDFGQSNSYRPNDDAAGYQFASPGDNLAYIMAEGKDAFLKEGRLRQYIDLLVATTDNRGDVVGFGDTGAYSPRDRRGGRSGMTRFARTAAWYYGEGQFQWLADWQSDRDIPGSLAYGDYAVDIKPDEPTRYTGVFPVLLDEASLLFAARRTEKASWAPRPGKSYFDKISLRRNFEPKDEYLCLEGTSFFSHGHHDGNTVTRLTWKDRIWLFDLDYIDFTPRYHNGVTVVFNGRQDDPPPLNSLDARADLAGFGFLKTTSPDYNHAEWQRHIIWKKGRYFLFLDKIKALAEGDFRLDSRWRTRGDINLSGNVLKVRQGDKSFYINSADNAPRRLVYEPDKYRSTWDYPYGDGKLGVCLARKNAALSRNDQWTFANLMYAEDKESRTPLSFYRLQDGLYLIRDGAKEEIAGLNSAPLTKAGIATDSSLFVCDSGGIQAADASFFQFSSAWLRASAGVHLEVDFETGSGRLIVPEGRRVLVETSGLSVGVDEKASQELPPGTYRVSFKNDGWKGTDLIQALGGYEMKVLPGAWAPPPAKAGIDILKKFESADSLTSFCPSSDGILAGDEKGRVLQFRGDSMNVLFQVSSGRPLAAIQSADVDGDGAFEVIAGDDQEMLYCYKATGKLLWNCKMIPTNGSGVAADITVGDIDGKGKPSILVATKSWKLYAFNPNGKVRWESFLYYHPCTKVRILDAPGRAKRIAVGNVYHTPLNVVSPTDGEVLWHTWEQCGGEAYSTTDYCGFYLTDMVFLDTDGDGRKEIIFGTKHNCIYALDAADGATKWSAVVGDEVTAIRTMRDPATGEDCILAATDAGELEKIDRKGKRLGFLRLSSGITDLAVLEYPKQSRSDVVVALGNGGVVVCDHDLLVRGSTVCGAPLKAISLAGKDGEANLLYAISEKSITLLKYQPYFLRKSRVY